MLSITERRLTVGVLSGWQTYSGTLHNFLSYVFDGIKAAALDFDCNLLIGCGVGQPNLIGFGKPATPFISSYGDFVPIGPWNTDGLIVVAPIGYHLEPGGDYFRRLIAQGFPVVYSGVSEPGPVVEVDNEGGILQALQHLVDHGHRRILFVAGDDSDFLSDSLRRLQAYRAGVEKFNLDRDPDLIVYANHNQPKGREVIEDVINRRVSFSAILASNDESAIGAIEALHQAGLMVPQDVAVIGFDDRFDAKAQVPQLTTIHHPMYEMGYQSVKLFVELANGRANRDTVVKIPTHLMVRETCGCRPGDPGEKSGGIPGLLRASSSEQFQGLLSRQISAELHQDMQALRQPDLDYLCMRIVSAFIHSLKHASFEVFDQTLLQIIQHAANLGDDLFVWQKVISILKDHVAAAARLSHTLLSSTDIFEQLDRSRVAISEVARGQLYRNTVQRNAEANQIGLMISRFFAARSEAEIFNVIADGLPVVGIRQAFVAYYEPGEDDPVAWSVLQTPGGLRPETARFSSRAFPPAGLIPGDKPFALALLPLSLGEDRLGYVAFDAGSMDYDAQIVRQLLAAIQGVRLYEQAVDARKQAEEHRQIAEEANRSKSRFLSMVSHEVRTPLNLIAGLSDMLMKQSEQLGPGEYRIHQDDLDRIYVTSRHLDSLIQDVIELSSLDVGHLKLNLDRLDLHEVLKSVAVIGKQLAHNKGLSWSAEIANDLPWVLGDHTRLRQVILNLVNNAVKFTTHGRVSLTAFTENGRITVAVSDTGLGIPVEEHQSIFDEFRQSTRTSARGFGGLGLGLAISRRLVELHGGKLDVCSSGEENQGSMFFFSLPAIDAPLNLLPIETASGEVQRVMILVKEKTGACLLEDYLVRQGFVVSVLAADEGENWLADLTGFQPDAVVLDGDLTAACGWDILRQVKEKPAMVNVPVLFYTLNEADRSGAFLEVEYMVKPIEAANLAEILISLDLQNDPDDEEWAGKEKTILIADDDPGIRNLHSRIVSAQSQSNRIIEAHDGREALDVIRSASPDLVLLDLMMPEMDGFAVLEAMREDEASRNIPVVVVTGQRLTEEDMARLNAGVASVLSKGVFTPDETLQALSATLQRKRRPGTETQRLVLKAMAYIHTHYHEVLSRSDVAEHVGVSERHLSRCFQQEVGLTPMTYLNRFRVKVARSLLDAGELSITDVAMEVGFSTGGYFTRVFRDEMGVSPRGYLQSRC